MILQLYSVQDSKVGAFLPPFSVRSRGEAIRSFQAAAQDEKHQFFQFRSDFSLYLVGAFNDADGTVESVRPERVIGADEF